MIFVDVLKCYLVEQCRIFFMEIYDLFDVGCEEWEIVDIMYLFQCSGGWLCLWGSCGMNCFEVYLMLEEEFEKVVGDICNVICDVFFV